MAKLANVERRRLRNKSVRSAVKTGLTKAQKLIAKKQAKPDSPEVVQVVSLLDRAVKKGVIHRNQAARRKSRLMKKLNRMKES
ncbi:MAG: 30S ribosomal protein S20 [Dehalococcoidia bacterium]|nr:30S ribosomal protein S20 [Dehalococcoidia bacterium]